MTKTLPAITKKTVPAAPIRQEMMRFMLGHHTPEPHRLLDEDIDSRRWMRELESYTTFQTATNWPLFPQQASQIAEEHLDRVFTLIAGVVQQGLTESLTASTVLLLHRRVRDMDRRLASVEERIGEQEQALTYVFVDWDDIVRSAQQVGEQLGWSGTWRVNQGEHRLEFRMAAKEIDRVSGSTFEFYRHLAQKLAPEVMQHVTFDYEIAES